MEVLMGNRVWKAFVLFVILVVQLGCASSEFRGRGAVDKDIKGKEIIEETKKGDTLATIARKPYNFEVESSGTNFTGEDTVAIEERIEPLDTSSIQIDEFDLNRERYTVGYRIQVFASKDLKRAEEVKSEAERVTSLPAYIEFEDGLYKVRLGNFLLRDEAIRARDLLREHYVDCWIVQTTVTR